MEQVYLDFVEENFSRYTLDEVNASAFSDMMTRSLPGARVLKCQVNRAGHLRDAGCRCRQTADLLRFPAGRCPLENDRTQGPLVRERDAGPTGIKKTLVVPNEPYFASLGSSVVPLDKGAVRAGWQDIASLVKGGLGVHCCSNTDWSFVIGLDPSVISLDAYTTATEFLLYADAIRDYMERGGVVAWGMSLPRYKLFACESVDSLYARYARYEPAQKNVWQSSSSTPSLLSRPAADRVCRPERCRGDPAGRR